MRRMIMLVAGLMLVATAAPAHASPPRSARPVVDVLGIVATHTTPEGNTEYTLGFDVVDPDGFVVELMVDLGDGVTAWLSLLCDPAIVARGARQTIETSWSYAPGRYVVRAVAYSVSECEGGSVQKSAPGVRSIVAD